MVFVLLSLQFNYCIKMTVKWIWYWENNRKSTVKIELVTQFVKVLSERNWNWLKNLCVMCLKMRCIEKYEMLIIFHHSFRDYLFPLLLYFEACRMSFLFKNQELSWVNQINAYLQVSIPSTSLLFMVSVVFSKVFGTKICWSWYIPLLAHKFPPTCYDNTVPTLHIWSASLVLHICYTVATQTWL